MKNGMVELALDSGKVEFLTADYVRENDIFELKKSASGDDFNFQPAIKNRGEVIGFFAALKLKTGSTYVKWMTREEVEEFRDNYSSMYKFSKENSAWTKSFNGMGVKTVMKSLLRSISISNDLDTAMGADDFFEADFTINPGTSAEQTAEKLKEEKPEKKPTAEIKQGELL